MRIIKNVLICLILMCPILLTSCSAAAIKNDYQKNALREYEGPGRIKSARIIVEKSNNKLIAGDVCSPNQDKRQVKVSKIGNKFIITIEDKGE